MRSQLGRLCTIVSLALAPAIAAAACVNCDIPVVANPGWANGVLASGNYYAPDKSAGNWGLANSVNGVGSLELRNNGQFNYVYNVCPKTHSGYCGVYLNQVVTIEKDAQYRFTTTYSMENVRAQSNTLQMSIQTLPSRRPIFNEYTFAGNSPQWTDFTTAVFTAPISGDVLLTLAWRNDPNDAVVLLKNVELAALECANPATRTCSDPAATSTSTETTSSSTETTSSTSTETTSSSTETTSTSTGKPCRRRATMTQTAS
jgi:hypothetical protein